MTKREAKQAAKFTRDVLNLMNGQNGEHWTKHAARSIFNWANRTPKDGATCYCIVGAIRAIHARTRAQDSNSIAKTVTSAIADIVGYSISEFNDRSKTEWKDVKSVLTKVAKQFDKQAA